MPLCTREADVEQSPLLFERGRGLRELRRQLAFLQPRQEDGLELEPLCAVVREEVDPAARPAAEALLEMRDELVGIAHELLGQLDEPREVVLTRHLALAEAVWNRLQQTLLAGDPAHVRERTPAHRLQQLLRGVTAEQRGPLGRDVRI